MNREKHTIAVLGGTGAEGSGLARHLAHAGHRVIIGSRSPEKAEKCAAELNTSAPHHPVTFRDNPGAAREADLVILTVPYAAQRATVEEVREALAGKILVDVTVPLVPPRVSRVQLPDGGSAVAAIQESLGPAVRVVSAFQHLSAHHLKHLAFGSDAPTDILVCGDDREARAIVIDLASDIGLRGIHAGPICNSAASEALTSLLIAINIHYKCPGAGLRITGIDP